MALPIQSYDQIVLEQQNGMQSIAPVPLNLLVGSILRAIIESNSGNFLWLQALTTMLLSITRLTTSTGSDVDSYINQFGFNRFPGTESNGSVTFSRNVSTQQATIYVNSIVSVSSVDNLNFVVLAPPPGSSYPAYDPTIAAYVIPADTASIIAYVECQQVGTIGNVLIGAIDTIDSIIPFVDFVSNGSDFTNGINQDSDETTKQKFISYIQSLSRATLAAIQYAVFIVPGVVRFIVVENMTPESVEQLGYFYVVIDDGTGNASDQLITNVFNSVNLYRGLTIQFQVFGPTPVTANVSLDLTLIDNPSRTQSEITVNVQSAISAFINGLGFDSILPITRIAELAYDADDNILNVTNIELNSSSSDLTVTGEEIFIVGTISVSYP